MNQKGDGRRISRVEKEVHASIANYLNRLFRFEHGIVSVSKVILTADLKSARVYISLLEGIGPQTIDAMNGEHPFSEGKKASTAKKSKADPMTLLLHELKYEAFAIQNHITHELKLRYVPKLQFFKDETTEKVLAIEKTLLEIKKQDTEKK